MQSTEAEGDITVHFHTFTLSWLLVHIYYSGSLCAKEACLSIAGSKDKSVEMLYLQFQLPLIFMLCAIVLLKETVLLSILVPDI